MQSSSQAYVFQIPAGLIGGCRLVGTLTDRFTRKEPTVLLSHRTGEASFTESRVRDGRDANATVAITGTSFLRVR
jgi:hypothetical protein